MPTDKSGTASDVAPEDRGPASRELLERLHYLLARDMLARLERGRVSASAYTAITAFLKANGVSAQTIADRKSAADAMSRLLADAPPFGDDDGSTVVDFARSARGIKFGGDDGTGKL